MIDVKDRVPGDGKVNRKKLTFDDGTVQYAKVEFADDAVEPGTPMNRTLLMDVQGFAATPREAGVSTATPYHASAGTSSKPAAGRGEEPETSRRPRQRLQTAEYMVHWKQRAFCPQS